MNLIKNKILKAFLFIITAISLVTYNSTIANADGGSGNIKIYANVMEEQNFPIKVDFYERGSQTPIKTYDLDESNEWKVEDSLPVGEYDVTASMPKHVNYKIMKYPFKKEIEVVASQPATDILNGVFTIVQAKESYFDDYKVLLTYQDENGNYEHGTHKPSDAIAFKEELLKRQGEGNVAFIQAEKEKLSQGEVEQRQESVKDAYDERISKAHEGINPNTNKPIKDVENEVITIDENNDNSNGEITALDTLPDEDQNEVSENTQNEGVVREDSVNTVDAQTSKSSLGLTKIIAITLANLAVFAVVYYMVIIKKGIIDRKGIFISILIPVIVDNILIVFITNGYKLSYHLFFSLVCILINAVLCRVGAEAYFNRK